MEQCCITPNCSCGCAVYSGQMEQITLPSLNNSVSVRWPHCHVSADKLQDRTKIKFKTQVAPWNRWEPETSQEATNTQKRRRRERDNKQDLANSAKQRNADSFQAASVKTQASESVHVTRWIIPTVATSVVGVFVPPTNTPLQTLPLLILAKLD